MIAPLPFDETRRLVELERLAVLDTPVEDAFDRLTRNAVALFDVPIALVSLVDEDRQWFKSCVGLPVRETGREVAFCAHAILGSEVFVVEDAAADPRFAANPLVTDGPRIRFYAGAPLRTASGQAVGTFCVIDTAPRSFGPSECALLEDRVPSVRVREVSMEICFGLRGGACRS